MTRLIALVAVAVFLASCATAPEVSEESPGAPSGTEETAVAQPASDSPVDLSVQPDALRPGELGEYVVMNGGGQPVEYGAPYRLERWVSGTWTPSDLPCPAEQCDWPDILHVVQPEERSSHEFQAPEEPGRYRLVKTTSPGGTVVAEFEVTDL